MIAAPKRGSPIDENELDDCETHKSCTSVCLGPFRSSRASTFSWGLATPHTVPPAWRLHTRLPLECAASPLSHQCSGQHTVHCHVTIRDSRVQLIPGTRVAPNHLTKHATKPRQHPANSIPLPDNQVSKHRRSRSQTRRRRSRHDNQHGSTRQQPQERKSIPIRPVTQRFSTEQLR